MKLLYFIVGFLLATPLLSSAQEYALAAETELMSVRDLSTHGQHIEALRLYLGKDESTITLSDRLSAAKSAWALGLVERARQYWDESLATKNFVGTERERELLGRAILELQEGNFDEARARAERTAAELGPSSTRGQFWLLIAESLKAQGAYTQAETYYRRAIDEVSEDNRSEASYLLGETQLKLGLFKEARFSFSAVESRSKFSSRALRRLAEIDLSQRNFEGVLTWISEGRESNPQEFEESWVSYAQVHALVGTNQLERARKELEQFRIRNSERDPWYGLAEAMVEASNMESHRASVAHGGVQSQRNSADRARAQFSPKFAPRFERNSETLTNERRQGEG